jgi:ribulose-5-phosphate 4-epimerase/fuculose-1-phosphate aldolase
VSETGSVKFTCEHVALDAVPFASFEQLNVYRQKLWQLRLIGVDANGIGFGNLSVREGDNFYITGSGTGGKLKLELADYAWVTAYDFTRNWLRCEGGAIASSESLTHAAVYEAEGAAGAVIHCHDFKLWKALLGKVPTTAPAVSYGTPEMADEVRRLSRTTDIGSKKIFVMAGHREGVVTFGKDLAEAFAVLRAAQG